MRISGPVTSRLAGRCSGPGCPKQRISMRIRRSPQSVGPLLHRPLRRGAVIELVLTQPGFRGIGWRLRATGKPLGLTLERLCVVKAPDRLGRCPKA
jgi:hypothetical protein